MSNTRRLNHPCYSRGLFDIMSRGIPLIGKNQNYGQFPFMTTIGICDKNTGAEKNPEITAFGYGSLSTTLNPDNVYSLSGRFVAPNEKEPPKFYFDQEVTQFIAASDDYPASLANKTSVWGIGIIAAREEFAGTRAGELPRNLCLSVRHTDYNNNTRQSISFTMDYVVPGNPLLVRQFSNLNIGLEVTLSGFICDYNPQTFVWEAHVLGISFHSGDQDPHLGSQTSTPAQHRSRRPGMMSIGSGSTNSSPAASAIASTSRSTIPTPSSSLPQDSPAAQISRLPKVNPAGDSGEEGEIDEDEHVQVNTFPPRRTLQDITKDAQKELKRQKRT